MVTLSKIDAFERSSCLFRGGKLRAFASSSVDEFVSGIRNFDALRSNDLGLLR